MKWTIKLLGPILVSTVCLSGSGVFAADNNKTLIHLDATRSAVEAAAGKIEGNREAAADLERAKAALKHAEDSSKSGKSMFGFGDINPETEREIKLSVEAAELATATALSRVELVRATAELDTIEKQFVAVKAKLKIFEDRKTEMELLRLEVAACQKTVNELETVKAEKAILTSRVEQLSAERSRADKLKIEQLELTRKLDDMKAENARLSASLAKPPGDGKAVSDTKHDDSKRNAPIK